MFCEVVPVRFIVYPSSESTPSEEGCMAVPNSCSTVSGFQGPRPPFGGLPRQAARLYITRLGHMCQQVISTFLVLLPSKRLARRLGPAPPLQSEISRRQASTAIIRRMAYSLAKPRGAADRASSDGRLPLPLEGPGGVTTEDARRSGRLIGNCRARRPWPGNVGVAGRASDRPTDRRIPSWHHQQGRESS